MRRSDVITGVAVVVASAMCGCASDDPAPPIGVDGPADAERLIRSGVGIRASGCSLVDQLGSGIAVGDARTIVTAAHTVAGARRLAVETSEGRTITADLVAFDPDRDLAVLRTSAPSGASGDVGLELADVTRGDATVVVWDPDAGVSAAEVDVTRRLAITIEDIYVEREVRRSGLEIAGESVVGDSGAGVVDGDGNVIGSVYAAARDRDLVGFAVDRDEVDSVLAAADAAAAEGRELDRGRCI